MAAPAYDAGTVHAAAQLDLRPYLQSLGHMEGATQASSSAAARHFRVVENATDSAQASARNLTGSYMALAGVLGTIGVAGLGASAGAVRLAGGLEQTSVAFEVMLGSAAAAKSMLDELQGFAATTPFQLPEIQQSARSLLAFGEAADQIPTTLRRIGDIAAGTQTNIAELATIYGKARVQGTLFAEDINQLTGRGIPVIQEFAKQLGVSESQVKKLASEGKVGFANLEQAFISLTSEGSKFGGLMNRMSTTDLGEWSTILDNATKLTTDFGEAMKPTTDAIQDAVTGVIDALSRMSDEQKAALGNALLLGSGLLATGAAVTALKPAVDAVIDLMNGLGLTMQSIGANAMRLLASPIGLAVSAVVAAVGGLFAILTSKSDALAPLRAAAQWAFEGFADAIGTVMEALQPFGVILAEIAKVVSVVLGAALIGILDVLAGVARIVASVLVPALQVLLLTIKLLVGAIGALGLSIADVLGGHFSLAANRWKTFWRDAVTDTKDAWKAIADGEARIWGGLPTSAGTPASDGAAAPATTAAPQTTSRQRVTFAAVNVDDLAALEAEALRLGARVRELNAQRINLDADSDEAKALGDELQATERHLGLITGRIGVLREGLDRTTAAASALQKTLAQGAADVAAQAAALNLAKLKAAFAGGEERAQAELTARRQEKQLANVKALAAAAAARDAALKSLAQETNISEGQRADTAAKIQQTYDLQAIALRRQLDAANALINAEEIRLQQAQKAAQAAVEASRAIGDLSTSRGRNAEGVNTTRQRAQDNYWAQIVGGPATEMADIQHGFADVIRAQGYRVQDAVLENARGMQDAMRAGAFSLPPDVAGKLSAILNKPMLGDDDIRALDGMLGSVPDAATTFLTKILSAYDDAKTEIAKEAINVQLKIDKASLDAAKTTLGEIFGSEFFNPLVAKWANKGAEGLSIASNILLAGNNMPNGAFSVPNISIPNAAPVTIPVAPGAGNGPRTIRIQLDRGLIGQIVDQATDAAAGELALVIEEQSAYLRAGGLR
jgi:tape measure domain-containing protein